MTVVQILDDIRNEIEGCYFVLCFDMDTAQAVGMSTTEYERETPQIAAAFQSMISMVRFGQRKGRNDMVRNALNRFEELILETDLSSFFILVPRDNDRWALAVGAPRHVHLEFARVALDKHSQALAIAFGVGGTRS